MIRLEHDVVQRALLGREASVDRERARDVRGITIHFTSGIYQQQIAGAKRGVILAVMQDAAVRATADDGQVRKVGVVYAKFVHHLGGDFVFAFTRLAGLHGPHMRTRGDARGFAHGVHFGAALEQAHVVQHVIERHDLLRGVAAVARLRTQPIHPADHALIELRMRAHGVEHLGAVLHEPRKDLVDVANRKGMIGTVVARGAFGSGTLSIPRFAGMYSPCGRPGTSTATESGSANPVR